MKENSSIPKILSVLFIIFVILMLFNSIRKNFVHKELFSENYNYSLAKVIENVDLNKSRDYIVVNVIYKNRRMNLKINKPNDNDKFVVGLYYKIKYVEIDTNILWDINYKDTLSHPDSLMNFVLENKINIDLVNGL